MQNKNGEPKWTERMINLIKMRYKDGEEISNSVGLLISILVRYPEIGSIKSVTKDKVLKFNFILTEQLTEKEFTSFKEHLLNSLEVYNLLEGKKTLITEIKKIDYEKITILEVERDVDTLNQEEISLIIGLMRDKFGSFLVSDNSADCALEEELEMQEELIEHMLEDAKASFQEKNLIGFREEGKVLVFNKDVHEPKS